MTVTNHKRESSTGNLIDILLKITRITNRFTDHHALTWPALSTNLILCRGFTLNLEKNKQFFTHLLTHF